MLISAVRCLSWAEEGNPSRGGNTDLIADDKDRKTRENLEKTVKYADD